MGDKYFSYYRVSSKDQRDGSSLDVQRLANQSYAKECGFDIVEEFCEVQSAAKEGRKHFILMLKKIKKNKSVKGIIFHDVDRSSRNIMEWARIHELKSLGYIIHFSRDKLILDGRSNMLLANMKAVVAADFSTNLSQETKKGLYQRLKEGKSVLGKINPGYISKGKGIRDVDPVQAPLVLETFSLFATGK